MVLLKILTKAKMILKDACIALALLYIMAMMGACEYAAQTYGSSYAVTVEKMLASAFIIITVGIIIQVKKL